MTWLRCEADGWERARVALRGASVEIPRDLAIVDLRMWQDRILAPGSRVAMPSRTVLAERWGWTDKRVRLLLATEEEWCDPYRHEEWTAYRAKHEGPAEGQRRASEGPAEGHRRVELPSPSPSPSPSLHRKKNAQAPEPTALLPGDRLPSFVSGHEAINACIDLAQTVGAVVLPEEHDAIRHSGLTPLELALIWDWFHLSGDDGQPRLARDSGWIDSWKSLLKSGQKWLQHAKRWHVAGRPTGPPARAAPNGRNPKDRPTTLSMISDLPD